MDPLSDVLSLLKLRSYMFGGFDVGGRMVDPVRPARRRQMLCRGFRRCWLSMEALPTRCCVKAGDCFLLPRGRPFRLASDLALTPVDARTIFPAPRSAASPRSTAAGIALASAAISP